MEHKCEKKPDDKPTIIKDYYDTNLLLPLLR
jgi:hypothetical protein